MTKKEKITIELIKEIYKLYPSGGALHIVLDDGNFEDHHIEWCLDDPIQKIENIEQRKLFEECAKNLLDMKLCRRYYCSYQAQSKEMNRIVE